MLAEERHALILDLVNQQGNVKLTELCSRLHASQSTIRRDLLELSEQGLLTKVHGGAISRNERFFPVEHNMEEKANLYIAEKTAIARYAASLLEEGDFVYLDAGTTTEKVIDFIPLKKITFVTNGFLHAKLLIVDEDTASVGTANMDYRSLLDNLEVTAFIRDRSVVRALSATYDDDLASCRRIARETWRPAAWRRTLGDALRLVSPLM